jgi:hypothetical protein
VIILGVVLLIAGFLLKISNLWTGAPGLIDRSVMTVSLPSGLS